MAELDEQFLAMFGVTAQQLLDFGELRSVDSAVGLVSAVAMVCLNKSNHVPHDLSWAGVRCVHACRQHSVTALGGWTRARARAFHADHDPCA